MILNNDYYTNLGSTSLRTCWTKDVTKFDASSFYNWEQDNLPVLDLEERTDFLWGRLGNATSAVNGFSWVVSSDVGENCTGDYFSSLELAINKLPEVINAPYIIEVAIASALGDLKLSNKIFGPSGSIEIINRILGWGSPIPNLAGVDLANVQDENSASVYGTTYGIASAIRTYSLGYAANQANSTPAPLLINDLSLNKVKGSQAVFSNLSLVPSLLTNKFTIFTRRSVGSENSRLTAALARRNSRQPYTLPALDGTVEFNAYETNPESFDSITTHDASCINEISNTEISWKGGTAPSAAPAASFAYGNYLDSVLIENCNGPIYIRGFTVDGRGPSGTGVGIEISNSTVLLERCSAARCKIAGLLVKNSDVKLARGFVAYRNYSLDSSGNRSGPRWLDKIYGNYSASAPVQKAAGIRAENSNIEILDTYLEDQARSLLEFTESSGSYNPFLNSGFTLAGFPGITADEFNSIPSHNWLYSISRNEIGIELKNSNLIGGKNEVAGSATTPYYQASQIFVELNTDAGIKMNSSILKLDGKLYQHGNFVGLEAESSDIELDTYYGRFNQKEAIRLSNSSFKYGKGSYKPSRVENTYDEHVTLLENGTHLNLTNSKVIPVTASSMPTLYNKFIVSGSFGVTNDIAGQRGIKPGIIVDSNSLLEIVHPNVTVNENFIEIGKPLHGAISVTNNSELVLKGSKEFATKVVGPALYSNQEFKAGIYGDSSIINIQGPTVIAKFAVDILADNNSTLNITPHLNSYGKLDVTGYNLDDKENHTSVELHSTRACIVVDNNSVANFKDLGDYTAYWKNGAYGTAALLSGVNYETTGDINTATYTSGGSLQFYPNPGDVTHYPPANDNPSTSNDTFNVNAYGYNCYFTNSLGDPALSQEFSSITVGGMCLRALNNSIVSVDNVHFPAGWWNPSGIIYDVSGADSPLNCNRLFIWNIANNSYLDSKLVSVSGLHPADAAYFGPSGTWGSASAAPVATPDTSSVSILDFYGRATNHRLGRASATNQGPFRLYFSTDPAINWALDGTQTLSGFIPQVYAQGYQFSGNMIFPGNVSSAYTSIIKNDGATLTASGFYYANAIVHSPGTAKAMLDDSSANAFANAKHCSVGKSNIPKVVSIYYPYTGSYGGDSADSQYKSSGRGVRSVNTFDLNKIN
jgi:hypothetical protein